MPIPALNNDGLLPDGIHDCTLEEIQNRFGSFQRTDARCRLFERLAAFIKDARASKMVVAIVVDGSFVTDKDVPNDIDIIVVLESNHDYSGQLRPSEYNVVSSEQARRLYKLDALVGRVGKQELDEHIFLFSRVRHDPDLRKGMLRIVL